MDPKKNYYEVLGLSENALGDEIRKAFRRLARKHHPDVNPGDKNAETRFKEINEAHEVLSDPKKRREYDAIRRGAFTGGAGSGPGGFEPGESFSWGGAVDVEDLFGDFLRGGGFRPGFVRGSDLTLELRVDFLDLARGAVREIAYRRPRRCPVCRGSGRSGKSRCAVCGGSGRTEAEERIKVRIPAGAEDGARIRVAGKGEAGESSAAAGDLVILLRMIPHPYFRREGKDIRLDLPVHYSEAALGARITVPTIDGPVTVTVPPGSSSGTKLRLKGRGVPGAGTSGRGDQLVVLHVAVPREQSSDFRALVEKLRGFEDPNLRSGWN